MRDFVKYTLDEIDKKILFTTYDNARKPLSWIAKQTGFTREVVEYRLKKMQEQGIIRGFYTRLNQGRLYQGAALLQITLTRLTDERLEVIVDFLLKHERVIWFAQVCGLSDITAVVLYNNLQELADIVADINQFIGENLKEHKLQLYISEFKFTRKGLIYEKPEIQKQKIRFEGNILTLETVDKKILEYLAINCRMSNSEIARELKISEDKVRLHIKKLEKKGIILDYAILLSEEGLGTQGFTLNISFENMTNQTVKRLEEYIDNNPFIIFAMRITGEFDVSMTIYAKDVKHFNKILFDIRGVFGTLITNYEFMLIIKEHKESYLTKEY